MEIGIREDWEDIFPYLDERELTALLRDMKARVRPERFEDMKRTAEAIVGRELQV